MISAFLTSMAGTFYAQYILYIDPESVMILPISVQIVLVAMLGGASTVLGPVVGAAEGLTIPMLPESLVNFMFHSSKLPYYYIMLSFLLLAVAVCYWVSTSKMGYYFRAIKESHEIAQVLGVNVVRYRLFAIMISAFLTSMAGTFYAQYILYIDPESVMILPISVQIVLVAMLGGASTVLGPVVGAAILIPLSEYSRAWLGYKGTGVDMIIYGTLITIISMYQPAGVWGSFLNMLRREGK